MIIRNTELAASREKFEEVEKRYKEVQANCSPPALIHKLKGESNSDVSIQCSLIFPSFSRWSSLTLHLMACDVQMPQMKLMKSLRTCIVAF